MAVVGVGVDMANVALFADELRRTHSSMLDELFTPRERKDALSSSVPRESLAGKFAAKEALYKAFGGEVPWDEIRKCEVSHEASGRPVFRLSERIDYHGIPSENLKVHLSISHEMGMAVAMVVVEVAHG